jgi:hypothetical protein
MIRLTAPYAILIAAALIAVALACSDRYHVTPHPTRVGAYVTDGWTGRTMFCEAIVGPPTGNAVCSQLYPEPPWR